MTKLTVAALQLAFTDDTVANIKAVADLVREAASKGAEVVLPPELFEGPYFCRVEDEGLFANARVDDLTAAARRQSAARELLPRRTTRHQAASRSTTRSRTRSPGSPSGRP